MKFECSSQLLARQQSSLGLSRSRISHEWNKTPKKILYGGERCILWRSISAKIQLLNFACVFGIRCSSFTICTFICNWTFKFPLSLLQVSIWHCFTIHHSSLRNSTLKFTQFTQFNIQVYAIPHLSLRNSTFKFMQFNIQVYAIQHSSFCNSTSNFRRCLFSISDRKPVNDSQCGLSKLSKFRLSRG